MKTIVRPTISCATVVRDEEHNIRECLESAKWMDEIIVVDAFSVDRTVEICREFTGKIFSRPWNGFGEQKNYAADLATSEWVFILDADERVSPELRVEMERVLACQTGTGPVAYYVPRRNIYFGRWIKKGGQFPDYQLRLFRRGIGKLDDSEPHNRFVFQGDAGHLHSPLDHYTKRRISDQSRKFGNFTALAARELARRRRAVYWTDLLFRPVFTFWKHYVVRQGFQDGIHGLIICVFASTYTFVKYAKLWELLKKGQDDLKANTTI